MCTDLTLQKIKLLYSDTSLSHSPLRCADSQGFPDGDHGVLPQHSPQACSPWSGLPARDSPGWDCVLFIDLA